MDSVDYLVDRGAKHITCICILSAPEGVETLRQHFDSAKNSKYEQVELSIFVAAQDDHLNEHGYIVPGLGDAGDRLYGID
jgi:uracil phosphoribosyltransferase